MKLAIIVAAARNGVIGRNNQLPWHLPQDLKYFKAVTMGKPVIMGRKTYDSIGKPLPGRTNIVITRDKTWRADGVNVVHSIDEALVVAGAVVDSALDEVMVIGGAEVYQSVLPLADRIYLTQVDIEPEGDAFFAVPDASGWDLSVVQNGDSFAPLPHRFLVYQRAAHG